MTLKNTPDGFLAGQRIDDTGKPVDEQAELLADIKSDTGKLLDVARAQLRATTRPTVVPAGRSGPASTWAPRGMPGAMVAAGRVATPAGRRTADVVAPRDSAGRFVGRATMRASDLAAAVYRLAQVGEQQRRDTRASREASPHARRDAAGRFQGDGEAHGGPMAAARLPSLASAGQVDPLLASVSDAASVLRVAGAVAVPPVRSMDRRAGSGPVGLLRSVSRELRALRKDGSQNNRSTLAKLAALFKASGKGAAAGGGGPLAALVDLLPALPSLLAPLGAIGGGLGLALKAGGQLVRRIPLLGAAVDGLLGIAEDQRIASDGSLSPEQQRQARAANAGGTLGGMGGTLAGALAGQAMIPIPVVGAVVGAVAGSYLGKKAGRAAGGGAAALWAGGAKANIVGGAAAAGVDPGLVAQIANFESGFNSNARPIKNGQPMSSAHGYGQLLDGTWVDMVRKHGQKHGVAGASVLTKDQALSLRDDPKLQAAMLAELTAENVAKGRALGGKDDAANVYALHNLGAGDGAKFLKALASDPSASVSSILSPKVIDNNPSLYKGGSVSVGEAYATMGRKMAAGGQFAADARAALQAGPGAAPPVAAVAAAKPMPVPTMPAIQVAAAIPPVPEAAAAMPQRLNSSPTAAPAAPPPPPAQDVRDRLIAHVVTGGIGGLSGIAHR